MYKGGQGVQVPCPHTISIFMCCLCEPDPTAPEAHAAVQLLPTSLQLYPGLCFSLSFIYILNIEISFTEEITLTTNLGREFPVVKILDRTCNEWLQAKDNGTYGQNLWQPSIPHLPGIWQLFQFRRVRIYSLWKRAVIPLFCYSANQFLCISF